MLCLLLSSLVFFSSRPVSSPSPVPTMLAQVGVSNFRGTLGVQWKWQSNLGVLV